MRRSDAAMARRVDDELVILDVESGQYFGLNDVGALVWDQLTDECTEDALVDAVTEQFDVDREQATRDISDLIGQLVDRNLVSL